MRDPAELLKAIELRQRAKRSAVTPPPPPTVTEVVLPVWQDGRRAAPSAAFRSALFPALGRVKRKRLWDEPIFAVAGLTVAFRGEQLDQSDLDVYLDLLHRLRESTTSIRFTAYAILSALGRPVGSSGYKWLGQVIDRLTSGTVTIEMIAEDRRYKGHLVDSFSEVISDGAYQLRINPDFAALFGACWSSLDIAQRRALTSPTAKSLHAYYSSHKNPGFHAWETLASITGAEDTNRRRQRARLGLALDDLVNVGFLSDWTSTSNGVQINVVCVDKLLA